MTDKNALETTIKWIQALSKGVMGRKVESSTLEAIELDKDGHWHTGAMATLIDSLEAAAAAYSFSGIIKASLDFILSFYSTVNILEEVDIEAKVVGSRGKLTAAEVEVKRKDSGQLIALGILWTTSTSSQGSKL